MWKFTKELSNELADYPLQNPLNIEGFCFHIGKLHHELVRMPEENAAALLNYFGSLRELLDFYAAGEGLRPVLPPDEPEQAVQPVQDAVKLRSASIWRHPEDEENRAGLPDGPSSLVFRFSLEGAQERAALETLLIKRIAARRVPAFCFSVDYEEPDAKFLNYSQGYERTRAQGEVWRCLPNTLEFSTARTPANYRLMGAASAQRACQVFHAQFVAPMDNIQTFEL
jgi:hypothetical protein